jgi:uncharacterized membrane protein (UPF0182 family)
MSRRPTIIDADPPPPPQPRARRGGSPPSVTSRGAGQGFPLGWGALVALFLLLFVFGPILLEMSVDWQWFGSLGLQSVYGTRLGAGLGAFALGTVIAVVFLAANWLLARRVAAPRIAPVNGPELVPASVLRRVSSVAMIVVGLVFGLIAGGAWSRALVFADHSAFGTADPIFNQDIGFYMFELPFYEFLRSWALGLIVMALIGAAIIYATRPALFVVSDRFAPDHRVLAHVTVLAATFLGLMAVGYWFQAYDLLFEQHKAVFGAGYTDVNARLIALRILTGITVIIALLVLANLRLRAVRPLLVAVGVWILAQVVVGGVYPGLVQAIVVTPAEQDKESPYIDHNIKATRAAFGLSAFKEQDAPVAAQLQAADINTNRDLVNNIRLWDYRPLRQTYSQLQSLRPYYVFQGVDLDRYKLAGGEEQVMISARELNTDDLPTQAHTWQNIHLVYTHGYGVVASPVNRIENAGQPHFLVRDLPVVSDDPALAVTRPQIYFGEAEDNYAVVGTTALEFDYPKGATDATTTYTGTGGVRIGGFLNRLQLATYFGDFTLLISEYIQPDSRALFHRNISDAVSRVAPFLTYDPDPYIVIADGKLYWMQDAYTTSDRYPYSSPTDVGDRSINYIRNSVKVVIDAYDGSMTYYVMDTKDPVVATYRKIFPALFKDGSEMPASLQAHIRYPEQLFNIQAQQYSLFHMTDPSLFYNRSDAWRVPFGNGGSGANEPASQPLEAYYTMMRLPGESQVEFMLMVPFTPSSKPNMIAWMAARGDAPDYGRVDVIRFPSSTVVYGPQQISAFISQDPQISSQLSLWNQSGSQVVLGNLLILPLGGSVLSVQPLFLQATAQNSVPALKRVITSAGGQVGMGETLADALTAMFKAQALNPANGDLGTPPPAGLTPLATPPLLTPGLPGTPLACTGDARSLSNSALDHYERALAAQRAGDWATYGSEQAQVEAALRCLQQVTR